MASGDENIHLEITLQAGDVGLDTFQETTRDVEGALKDIERQITGKAPKVDWRWAEEPVIRAFATPNGIPTATLEEIVGTARLGFQRLVDAKGGQVNWPQGFGEKAKRAIKNVVKKLEEVEAITVDTLGEPPLVIDQITLQQTFGQERLPREVASIDGILELISIRGRLHITIEEHGTGKRIRCLLPESMRERAKDALGYRVVIEGTTFLNAEGEPSLITEITDLWVRPNEKRPLEDLRGSAPDFTEGEPAEDYVHNIRGQRNGGDDPD